MHPPRTERIVMTKRFTVTVQLYPFSPSAFPTADIWKIPVFIWKIPVFLQHRRHLKYHLVQMPHSYIILLAVNWSPIFCCWRATGTNQKFLHQIDDELSYCLPRHYCIRISAFKHLYPKPPRTMNRSLPPRLRPRHLGRSRTSPPLRTRTAVFPLLCRCFRPLRRASCCERIHDAANAPPNATLLAPQLLHSDMLYNYNHFPQAFILCHSYSYYYSRPSASPQTPDQPHHTSAQKTTTGNPTNVVTATDAL